MIMISARAGNIYVREQVFFVYIGLIVVAI